MANINSEMAELKMIAINISALQNQQYSRMEDLLTKQFDALTQNLSSLGAKVDAFIASSSQKDTAISTLTAEVETLKAQISAAPAGDSPEAIQAAADQAAAIAAKIPS